MVDIKVINEQNDALDLSNDRRYTVYRVDGLTPSKASISSTALSAQNGAKFDRVNIEGRNIVIYLKINGDISENRIALYQWFATGNFARIEVKSNTREAFIEGYVESFECDIFSNNQTAQISITCESPYFKSIRKYIIDEVSYLKSEDEYGFSINYNGDADTGFVFEKYAGGTTQNLTLTLNDDFLGIDPPSYADRGSYYISTQIGDIYAYSEINGNVTANLLDFVRSGSKFLQLKKGLNVIVVTGQFYDAAISYHELYGGI